TTVFVKGCAMGCFWCHNPEGRHPYRELQYFADRCISCGECVRVCPTQAHELHNGVHHFLRERCRTSGECVEVCCSGALEMNGREMDVDEVMEEVVQDRLFYQNSGGGVTISGGEPGLNAGFTRAILSRCKEEGLHTAIETCGYCSWNALESLLPFTDLVMMDLKLITDEKHRQATGNTNELILANARKLAATATPIIFRTPVVPTVNDTVDEVRHIVAFIRDLMALRTGNGQWDKSDISYEFLAFHKLGSDKYRSLGMEYRATPLDPPTRREMSELLGIATEAGIEARIR
ncbi:MAG: glycyl-radical enzyme activating protein, partial [Ignavibacteria bacterium]|nr:glycyl-radical enzyme activating protein [Ignavibacteria bacterium]